VAQADDLENPAVSSIFDVQIRLSPKCIHGYADFGQLAANGALSPLFSLVVCNCEPGYTGKCNPYSITTSWYVIFIEVCLF